MFEHRERGRTRSKPGPSGRGEAGEGVISTAIAVLIVALLGVALWAGFSVIMDDATARTSEQIQSIDGSP
ncbi:MAG: hypothetical protein H6517_06640 [Microthrixaceae bacterium]|nr:hypothetical protein [Microthrixaceae bacterium]MCO5322022.1 hypothetical protein [Microthrixaceae bacterium]